MNIMDISNNESIVKSMSIFENCVTIDIEMWNGKMIRMEFKDYLGIKEKNCINQEIGDIIIPEKSDFLSEIDKDYLRGDGNGKELEGTEVIQFFNIWDDMIIIEIIAKQVIIKEI